MSRILSLLAVLGALLICFIHSDPARAQTTRAWVSGAGDDNNPCSRAAPCKTFTGALSKTAIYGEIDCLDPDGAGAMTITKSITIDCHLEFGAIMNAGSNGVTIAFDSFPSTDTQKTVRLHGITINGVNTGTVGVLITGNKVSGGRVFIEDCVIDGNFGGAARGISDQRAAGGELYVTNTTVRNTGATGIAVVVPATGSTAINASINHVRVQNSKLGLAIANGVNAMVSDSVFSGNASAGIEADVGTTMVVNRSVISGNGTGIVANGTVRISNSDIAFNTAGLAGTIQSFTNNRFTNNGAGGTISPIGTTANPTGQQ